MEVLASMWVLVVIGFVLVAPLTLFLPFYMAAKARGCEKALQEIALQIQLAHAKDEPSIFTR